MTVPDQTPISRSTGNGVTTIFAYDFKILAAEDLLFEVDDLAWSYPADYSVTGVGNDAGGSVICNTAPANGTSVVRRLNMAFERETDYQDQGELPTQDLDDDFDRAVLLLQQLREVLSRSLTLPPSYSGGSALLPVPEALKLIGWNSTGDGLANYAGTTGVLVSAAMEPVLAAASLALARAALGAAGSGAISSSGLTQATARMLGRITAGTGAPEELTAAQVAAFVAGATTAAQGAVRLADNATAQAGTDAARAITPAAMKAAQIVNSATVATTSGTAIDVTGIPAYAKRVVAELVGVGTNATDALIAQIGDSGGVETSGYSGVFGSMNSGGAVAGAGSTAGAQVDNTAPAASSRRTGQIVFQLQDEATNTWTYAGIVADTVAARLYPASGSKALSPGPLDRVRLTTAAGTAVFAAGTLKVSWE